MSWKPKLNPDQPGLYGDRTDVDWIDLTRFGPGSDEYEWARNQPWHVTKPSAEAIIRRHPKETMGVIAALASWRTCAISQLQDGLCPVPVPDFDREHPNMYSALMALGVLKIGFSGRERHGYATIPQVWLALCIQRKQLKHVFHIIDADPGAIQSIAANEKLRVRCNARHNTYACHLGLTLAKDSRCRFTCGDGWAGLRTIDPQARAEAGLPVATSGDLVALLTNNVLANVEVQTSGGKIEEKASRWARMLAASPIDRRGIVCVWLAVRKRWANAIDFGPELLDPVRNLPEASVPLVQQRMGFARWDEWFDPKGLPTSRLGTYTDLSGLTRSLFDPQWAQLAPKPKPLSYACDWGWRTMRMQLRDYWGWDPKAWAYPQRLRGGFRGAIGQEAEQARTLEQNGVMQP